MASLPFADGTRLLHIGPPKTGTTTLQNAFHVNREALALHGVHYAGKSQQARAAAAALALNRTVPGSEPGTLSAWDNLVAEVRGVDTRCVVISSETFAHCDDRAADTAVAAFDASRLQLVMTMRPLADILPSAWQQYVQEGMRTAYPVWLKNVLENDVGGAHTTPSFWRRMRIDRIAQRWADRIGADRVTLVSLAEQPHDFVMRIFEQMTGLPAGTLVPDLSTFNSSVPFQVVETIRAFNHLYWPLEESDRDVFSRVVPQGLLRDLKYAGGDSLAKVPIGTPQWASDRACEYMQEMNVGLRASGVNIIGDIDALATPGKAPIDAEAPGTISAEDAAVMLLSMMRAADQEGARRERRKIEEAGPQISGREALGILRRRLTARLRKS